LLDVDYDHAIAVIMSRGRENLIAATQHVLPHDLRRHIRVARLGQITVRGATNESALALRIEPSRRFAVWNYGGHWPALLLLALSTLLLLLLLRLALSAASTLIASASAVVSIALAGMTMLLLIAVAAMIGVTARLLIVLLLLLRASAVAGAVGGLRILERSRVGIGSRGRRGLRRWSWCGRGKCW
jgi:hypothetical protein